MVYVQGSAVLFSAELKKRNMKQLPWQSSILGYIAISVSCQTPAIAGEIQTLSPAKAVRTLLQEKGQQLHEFIQKLFRLDKPQWSVNQMDTVGQQLNEIKLPGSDIVPPVGEWL